MNFIPESNQSQPQQQNQSSASFPQFTIDQQDVLSTLDTILNGFSDDAIATLGIANIGALVRQLLPIPFPIDFFANTDDNINFLTNLFHKLNTDWSEVIVNETISISQVGAYQKCFIDTLKTFASGFFKDQNEQSLVISPRGAEKLVDNMVDLIEGVMGINIPSRLEYDLVNFVLAQSIPSQPKPKHNDELEWSDRTYRRIPNSRRRPDGDRRIDSDPREEDRREQTFRRIDDFESRHGRHHSRSR